MTDTVYENMCGVLVSKYGLIGATTHFFSQIISQTIMSLAKISKYEPIH